MFRTGTQDYTLTFLGSLLHLELAHKVTLLPEIFETAARFAVFFLCGSLHEQTSLCTSKQQMFARARQSLRTSKGNVARANCTCKGHGCTCRQRNLHVQNLLPRVLKRVILLRHGKNMTIEKILKQFQCNDLAPDTWKLCLRSLYVSIQHVQTYIYAKNIWNRFNAALAVNVQT